MKLLKSKKRVVIYSGIYIIMFMLSFFGGIKYEVFANNDRSAILVSSNKWNENAVSVDNTSTDSKLTEDTEGLEKSETIQNSNPQGSKNADNSLEENKDKQTETKSNSSQPADSVNGDKIAYLTFDDGPSANITPQILNILEKYNIKATFFVIGRNVLANSDLLKREVKEGHNIANHTFSHDTKYLYKTPENLIEDFKKGNNAIKSVIPDYNSNLVRFPGGSMNKPKIFIDAVVKEGYRYVDWNCLSNDAEHLNVPANTLIDNVRLTSKGKKDLIILMHDSSTKQTTADSLPAIIEYLKSQGYEFKVLN